MTATSRDRVFVCYASKDAKFKNEMLTFLKPMGEGLGVELWSDQLIQPGTNWRDGIMTALTQARVGILLLSPDFFASDFIKTTELPALLQQAEQAQTTLLLVPLRLSLVELTPLEKLQAVCPLDQPMGSMDEGERDKVWYKLFQRIQEAWAAPIPSSHGSFRVLLLATQTDLGEAVEKIRAHLTRQGMEVHTHPADATVAYDHTVLIQAWRWQDGAMVQLWEQVPKKQRSLLLIKAKCAWPMEHVEFEAHVKIQKFRKDFEGEAHSFATTQELPAALFQLLEPLRRAALPSNAPEVGLSELERAYLELNLPAWRIGRNRRLHPSQGSSYETNRFYKESLYVAMDGHSPRFGRNSQGEIVQVPGLLPNAKAKAEKKAKKLVKRLPLAVWAAAPSLRWLVVSGSPGAGKTVFLTRVAAQLAAHLLGEEIDGDPQLEALLPQTGMGPIPIVIEALNLAEAKGIPELVQALGQALALAGSASPADNASLEQQLRNGRFLLLIDALDEVASEQQRRALVDLLKGLAKSCPKTRLLLTTRSAQYTGVIAFAPEFEIVELMPFDQEQVAQFCRQYRIEQTELPGFEQELLNAINALEQRERAGDHESFSGNALMLTTLCWLYQRDRRLPNDRVSLCNRLVDGLCEARSQLGPDGILLNKDKKRELLGHLALAMQKQGRQAFPHCSCLDVIAEQLPVEQRTDRTLQERLLRCLVEQTGLMYYEASPKEGEQLRFVHRLFREYLAACRLSAEDRTMEQLVDELAQAGQLTDPFWFDAVRMLPGVLNSSEKAKTFAQALRTRAEASAAKPRLWGTLAATLQENRHLYEGYDLVSFTRQALDVYEVKGIDWPRDARFLLLEGIGKLGDPRLDWRSESYWVRFTPGSFTMGKRVVQIEEPFYLAKYPVTHGEYQLFVDADGYENLDYWSEQGRVWLKQNGHRQPEPQFCQNNQPRVWVCYHEAEAYCAWLRIQGQDSHPDAANMQPCLPSEAQWEYAALGQTGATYPWRTDELTDEHANYERKVGSTSPVGGYPKGKSPDGLCDMGGNVWEWNSTSDEQAGADRVLRGGSWFSNGRNVRSAYRDGNEPGRRNHSTGFRLARGQQAFKAKKNRTQK